MNNPQNSSKSPKKSSDSGVPQRKAKKSSSLKDMIESRQTDLSVESILLPDEKVIVRADIHWGIYWKSAVVVLFGLLVAIYVLPIGFIILLAGAFGLAHSYLMTKLLLLVLTNKRILMRQGILQVDVVDMRFKNTESLELERMLPGFILGYSNVIIMGIGQRFVRIPYVSNGVTFRRAFNQIVLQQEELERREPPAPKPAPKNDDEAAPATESNQDS